MIIDGLRPGQWARLPGLTLKPVLAEQGLMSPVGVWGWTGIASVMIAYSGMAYDPAGHVFYFHGGGHMDYGGNEVYFADLENMTVGRLTNPAACKADSSGNLLTDPTGNYFVTADGTPLASHTYDGLCWCPLTKTLFLFQGSLFGRSGNGPSDGSFWEFDSSKAVAGQMTPGGAAACWTKHMGCPFLGPYTAKWVAAHRKIIVTGHAQSAWFDPVAKTWSAVGPYWADTFPGCGTINTDTDELWWLTPYLLKEPLTEPTPAGFSVVQTIGANTPPNINQILDGGAIALCYDPARKRMLIWNGGASINTYDPATNQWGVYSPASGPPFSAGDHPYSKFVYIPDADCFIGFGRVGDPGWVWKPDTAAPMVVVPDPPIATVANADGSNPVKYRSLQAACVAVTDGQVISLIAGSFKDGAVLNANNVTINGAPPTAFPTYGPVKGQATGKAGPSTHIYGLVQEGGVGVFAIHGNNTTINDLEISGGVTSGNTSAIRLMGSGLTLNRCWLHDCDMNFLSSVAHACANIVFNNTWLSDSVAGQQLNHNAYIDGLYPTNFTMNGGGSLRANGRGHLVKSRAYKTTIERCTIAMMDANSSRCIDISDGGAVTILNSVLEVGDKSDNNDAIGIALELAGDIAAGQPEVATKDAAGKWTADPRRVHSTYIQGNTVVNDMADYAYHGGRVIMVHSRSPVNVVLKDNIFISSLANRELGEADGGGAHVEDVGGNKITASRSAAGLQPYPALPPAPRR